MSFLTDINCSTVLEAIKKEKLRRKHSESDDQNFDYININPQEIAFWTDLFANCFLCYDQQANTSVTNSLVHDDMLFFVSKLDSDQSKVEVYRRDSKKLPILTDFNYDWEETVYLNLILHEFEYVLTCAICTQTGTKDLEILKRHSKRVFASPSKRDLQSKGTEEEITYPNIYFTIDDFDSAFNEMIVKEGEMVCVELIANDGKMRKVLFLGSIKYESLKKVYDNRASTSAKIVQRVSFGSITQKRVEFVRMKGPGGKGYAEMAVSRFHNTSSNISTPLSVPSTPTSDQFNNDQYSSFWKISNNLRKKSYSQNSAVQSLAGTPEIECRDIRQDLIDSSNSSSFWGRTFGQTLNTFFNKSTTSKQVENINLDDNQSMATSSSNSIPLNAYLTYVTLKLQLIMQDVLETKQKSLLTF